MIVGHCLFARSAHGGGGIRTPDRVLKPYNGLANRRLQPLGHPSRDVNYPRARLSEQGRSTSPPGSAPVAPLRPPPPRCSTACCRRAAASNPPTPALRRNPYP